MADLLVIADDFTGALDTGVQFSQKGISTQVLINPDTGWNKVQSDIQVLVVDTQSRHLDALEAYKRVFHVCSQAKEMGVKYFYKKTDSTLRGNIGAELSALMDACNIRRLPFIPAYPKAGRTTKKGYQYVDGVPLDKTVFAHDPLNPIEDAYIPNIIRKQSENMVYSIDVSDIDSANLLNDKQGIIVVDAVVEEDMARISGLLGKQQGIIGVAGCAGFASYLPQLFSIKADARTRGKLPLKKPILVVCGSVNVVSLSQVKYAEKKGIKSILLSLKDLIDPSYPDSLDYQEQVETIQKTLVNDGCFILKTADDKGDVVSIMEESEDCSGKDMYETITESVGLMVRDILKGVKIGTLIVFGGDTALGIMKNLNSMAILPQHELLPGIPISIMESDIYRGALITKAGGFGNKTTLMELIKFIIEEGR
ncbi:MAG: four-carbon acid sugar kinase family protein [Caldicoprobacterales bacterium]